MIPVLGFRKLIPFLFSLGSHTNLIRSNEHTGLDPPSTTKNRGTSGKSGQNGRGLSNSSDELSGINPSPRKPRSGRRLSRNSDPRNDSRASRGDAGSVAGLSVLTMESMMSEGAQARAREDLEDDAEGGDKLSSNPWFCFRIMLVGMVAVLVSFICFMASCKAFRYNSWDDGVQYYGIRGVSEPTTDRCIPWKTQDLIDWNKYWTNERLPMLFVLGIAGIIFIVAIAAAWLVYGIVLKSKRDRKKVRVDPAPEDDRCGGPIGPAVIIGVSLIMSGFLLFVTIMGNCSNIPPQDPMNLADRGLMCNLHTWSALALTASIALCTMGGVLACFLKCCCNSCLVTTFLRKQLIEP